MDERDFAIDQLAHQNVIARGNGISDSEDLATLRMAPPAAANRTAGNGFGEARHGTSRSLQHDPVACYEGETLLRCHGVNDAQATDKGYSDAKSRFFILGPPRSGPSRGNTLRGVREAKRL